MPPPVPFAVKSNQAIQDFGLLKAVFVNRRRLEGSYAAPLDSKNQSLATGVDEPVLADSRLKISRR
jgi:hypothetical protein